MSNLINPDRPLLAFWRCQALVTMGRRARWGSVARKRLS